MNIYILLGIITVLLIIEGIIVGIKKNKWFMSLKPGDEILVKMFSEDCDCYRKATVVNSPTKKPTSSKREVATYLVEVKLDEETFNKCKQCAEEHDCNCWYNITLFSRHDVKKIKK